MRAAERLGVDGGDLEMLRRQAIGERRRLVEALDQDDGAEALPARPRHAGAGQRGELGLDGGGDGAAEAGVVGDQDRLAPPSSCSAWARRSAAIQAGSLSLSAMTTTSDGPAIMSMPTWPKTWRLAAAT